MDDSSTLREHLRAMLSDEFDCLVAGDGAAAFEQAVASHPEAIITDLQMPGTDGVELLLLLRGDPRTKQLPVVVVTTVMAVEQINQCRALGCVGFVLKPVQKEYLVAKLRQLTRRVPPAMLGGEGMQ